MKKLLRYLRPYRKESTLGPLFKLLEASFELLIPIVMANIIDYGIKSQNSTYIWKMGGLMILLGMIGLICSLTAQFFAAKAAVGFGTLLRKDLFRHINTFSYTEMDTMGTSTLITRMTSDINQIQSGVNQFLRLFLRSPFIVFGAVIMAFTINIPAALVFVIAIPLLTLVIFSIMLISIPIYKKIQKILDTILRITRENLIGARVIRSVCCQNYEIECFEDANNLLKNIQIFVGKISSLLNPATYILVNSALIAIVWIGGFQVNEGIITQGQVIALVSYMSQILIELVKLANLIISLTKTLACANRINDIFSEHTSIIEEFSIEQKMEFNKEKNIPNISFNHVSFSYKNSKEHALLDITFSIMKGETVGIIGATGSGKTSLIQLIPRFYDATSGEIFIDGINLKHYTLEELRMQIGIVPQKTVLFEGTIRDNMKWGNETATDYEIYQALEIAQGKEFVVSKPNGLDTLLSQNGSNLSGGQRQRLAIARALVRHPNILILDDSSSALDFATDAKLRHSLKKHTTGTTVLLVSQRASTIKNADHIVVLDDGRIVGYGKHSDLFQTCSIYHEICLSQLSEEEVTNETK